eukprot:2222132-Amphidinium_carterae.2
MAKAAKMDAAAANGVLKMELVTQKAVILMHSLFSPMKGAYESLHARQVSKNSFLGCLPEVSTRISGISHTWALV